METKEFKEWKKWYEESYPNEYAVFNDEILYEFYSEWVLGKKVRKSKKK